MALKLSDRDREQLQGWLRAPSIPPKVALHCRLVLSAALGQTDRSIAAEHAVNRHTVALWRRRVGREGIGCVWEIARGRGRNPILNLARKQAILQATLKTQPEGKQYWTCRLMAEAQGVSKNTIQRLWHLHNLKPHLGRTSKLARDPHGLKRLTDVIGLYLNPPQTAMVVCVAAPSQKKAPDRTPPGLRLQPGRSRTTTYDDIRNETPTLFAALRGLEGKVIGQPIPRHRHQAFLRFLRRLDREFPEPLSLQLVMDNQGTHHAPEVEQWLRHHPRFVVQFIPTGSSWVNLLERRLGEWTRQAVRRAAWVSTPDLVQAIEAFLAAGNQSPRPFAWTAKVENILAKLETARAKLEGFEPGGIRPRAKRDPEA